MGCRAFVFLSASGRLAEIVQAVRTAGKEDVFMRRTKERLLSLLLALVMVLGLLPATAWAAGENTISVSVSVFDQGEFARDKSDSPMMGKTVSVQDWNGDGLYSLDEALASAHEQYAPNGKEDYAGGEGDWGYSVFKLWGMETSALGFYKNDALTGAVDGEYLDNGDRVTAFIYKDQTNWSDRYSYFNKDHLTVCVGQEFELELKYDSWGTELAQATAPIGVFDEDGAFSVPSCLRGEELFSGFYMPTVSTDGNGKVKMSFTETGTYRLTAQYDSANYTDYYIDPPRYYLVPPLCNVTVLSAEDYAVYEEAQQYLDQARDSLTWDSIKGSNTYSCAVTGDLSIPSELTVDGKTVAVSWSCDDATGALSVSNYYGSWGAYVDRPAAQDVSCTLTATLSYGDKTAVKAFPITVKAEGVDEDKETVVTYGDLLSGIASGYAASADPWVVLEMAAYNGSNVKADGGYGYASVATLALADTAIGGDVSADTLDGVDISGYYAIYTIPYLSLAYQAAEIPNEDRMADMKAVMVDYLNNIETNYAGTDEVTPVLSALAPYYGQGDSGLDAAVDAAVTWLSTQQNDDGTFSYYGTSNANSTALAVVALSALGIDAHTDSRFIANYKSAMDGLFSFALADHSGFGYKGNVTKNALSTEQGFRALVAYARFKESGAAYNIYLQAKDSGETVAAPNITATTKPSGGGSGGGSASYRITVSVMVPPEGGADGQYTYRYDSAQYTNLLGSAEQVTVDKNTTALEVLTGLLDEADISYTLSKGYVSEIGGLAELDHGPNSGWQYMVDGAAPSESASTYTFSGSGKMVWYFTDDYTKEKVADSWSGGSSSQVSTDAKVTENKDGTYSVTLSGNSSGPVLVVIPDVEGQTVVVVQKDGTETVLRKSLVENGTARFLLEADATVKVVDRVSGFDDVARTDWYAEAVDFVSARGLFSGVSEREFAPGLTLSRGMLATVLYALEEPKDQSGETRFSDVDRDSWYARAVAWADGAGIVSGYGDDLFGPQNPVTREQLALMLYRYAQQLGMDTKGRDSLGRFADKDQVSSWAGEAVAWAVDAGLMSGRTDGTLDPAGTATRAEAAMMLRQFVALLLA